ncbi:photosystem I reaction center subunit XI [Aerosakkonemataceae cyanobacterium BLCC-F154]|uniref:Photosystem I reaction center subunit XI n=1 Tax=Floridaenema fluviatile BLCC-F154 TaxID=3153640 RepID=A0ABV4Y6C8_9CYAN
MQTIIRSIERSNDNPRDPRNQEVVYPAYDNPQIGNLETPINSSGFTKAFINNLPAYRQGLSPIRRGLEVGMAHGYWLIGPFAKLGPLRDSDIANLAGLISTVGLVVISTIAISLYASTNPPNPTQTVTTPRPPQELNTAEGWNEYASGFLIGGIGGALFAYSLLALDIPHFISTYLFQ